MATNDSNATSGDHAKDSAYFTSYEDLSVHELMLKDKPRTLAYKDYMEKNSSAFKDKIVIDVGAGSGILSLFAAKAGAKKVYAIEASRLYKLCEAIVEQNGLGDVITVVHGRVEDVQLPIEKADVLVSEWMGFYLVHEAMLQSVIFARDKWLATDGVMIPSQAAIYLGPVQMTEYYQENFAFWMHAYGCDLSPMAELVKQKALAQPTITTLKPEFLLAEPELVTHFDLMYVGADDLLKIVGNFTFNLQKRGICHGFACWFTCTFDGEETIVLSTGPEAPSTHWQQTVIFLPDAYFIDKGDTLSCQLEITQDSSQSRRYNICLAMTEEAIEDDEEDPDNEDYETHVETLVKECEENNDDIKDLINSAMSSS